MKLPTGWGCGAVEMRLYDESASDLTIRVTSCGAEPYIMLDTTAEGVALGAEDFYRLGDIAAELLDLFESTNSEAPDAGDKPATGITPTAEKEPKL
jgi:hypothetical protein